MQNFNTQAQFFTDWEKPMNINGKKSCKGYYNLIVSIHELKLWSAGLRAHSNQRLFHYKDYFGIKGDCATLLQTLQDLKVRIDLAQSI